MPRARIDTKGEIRDAATALFAEQGFAKTSLREVAERLGITKAALYYHFPSKADLLRGIVQPLIDGVEGLLRTSEAAEHMAPRELLESYFDLLSENREIFLLLVRDMGALAQLELMPQMFGWQKRLNALLVGAAPTPARLAHATVAIGGLQDCLLGATDIAEFREAALDAACAALGVES